jgi:hypothetical protein
MQELPGVHEHLARALSSARSAPGGGGQEACAPAQEQDSHSSQGKTAVTFKQAPWCGGGWTLLSVGHARAVERNQSIFLSSGNAAIV